MQSWSNQKVNIIQLEHLLFSILQNNWLKVKVFKSALLKDNDLKLKVSQFVLDLYGFKSPFNNFFSIKKTLSVEKCCHSWKNNFF